MSDLRDQTAMTEQQRQLARAFGVPRKGHVPTYANLKGLNAQFFGEFPPKNAVKMAHNPCPYCGRFLLDDNHSCAGCGAIR